MRKNVLFILFKKKFLCKYSEVEVMTSTNLLFSSHKQRSFFRYKERTFLRIKLNRYLLARQHIYRVAPRTNKIEGLKIMHVNSCNGVMVFDIHSVKSPHQIKSFQLQLTTTHFNEQISTTSSLNHQNLSYTGNMLPRYIKIFVK